MQAMAGSLTGEELEGILSQVGGKGGLSQVGGNSFMCDRRNLGCVGLGRGTVRMWPRKRFLWAARLPWLTL